MVPILDIRELLWFLPKSINFLKIYDTRCLISKYFKSFLWICDLAAVDNVMVDKGIAAGRNYRFVRFPKFITPICNVRELLRFLPKLTNFPEN